MKYPILILAPILLLITAPDICAHNLVGVNGDTQDHQHVYRRQQYGKPLQQGHLVQSPGESGMIMWESGSRYDYGEPTGRRSGPIIGDQRSVQGAKPEGSKKYGSEVKGYGKPIRYQ
jgi:hypothetical protein